MTSKITPEKIESLRHELSQIRQASLSATRKGDFMRVARLTPKMVAGFDTYGFDETGGFPELKRINENDLPGNEFWLGGEIVRNMGETEKKRLEGLKVNLFENPQSLLDSISEEFLGKGAK